MKKWLLRIGIGIIGLIVLLVLARNFIARKSVEVGVRRATGFPLEIGAVKVGLFNGQLDVRDLKLMNPADFEEKLFVDLPNLHVDYRLGSMLTGTPHINDMFLDISHLVIIKNKQGESNAGKLKGVVSSGKSSSKYRIDTFRYKIGTVTIKDFSHGKLIEKNIPLNITVTYHNITDSTDISRLVLLTVMSQVHLPDLGVKMDDLKKGLGGVQNLAGEAVKGATEAGKGIFDALKKAVPQK